MFAIVRLAEMSAYHRGGTRNVTAWLPTEVDCQQRLFRIPHGDRIGKEQISDVIGVANG